MSERYQRCVQVIAVLFFLACLTIMATFIIPFEPYKFYGYTAIPAQVCEGQSVYLYIDREVDGTYQLQDLQARSYWIDRNHPEAELAANTSSVPLQPALRKVVESPVRRVAPDEPGTYELRTDVDASGRVLFTERHQRFTVSMADSIEVLPRTDPRCVAAGGEL